MLPHQLQANETSKIRMNKIIWTFTCILIAVSAHAASFDCAKASTKVERMICKDKDLSHLDDTLSRAYTHALGQSTDTRNLRREQHHWLSKVRNSCKDATCIRDAYSKRIAELESHSSPSNTADSKFAQDERRKLVFGGWDAGSAAFYGYGFTITDKTISLEGCHGAIPYEIIKIKDGNGPTQMEPRMTGNWHEIALQLKPTGKQAACVGYQVLDFKISDDATCSAGITLYGSVANFKEEKYDGWGVWAKDCRD